MPGQDPRRSPGGQGQPAQDQEQQHHTCTTENRLAQGGTRGRIRAMTRHPFRAQLMTEDSLGVLITGADQDGARDPGPPHRLLPGWAPDNRVVGPDNRGADAQTVHRRGNRSTHGALGPIERAGPR
ncbi:hypothetical protein Kisp02_27640 [Kineosporia sp. NBRC 101731]|nr:hypothetical protein Kisp02_27640 [Kineosporia sp. NBRC 101731]